MKRHLTSRIKHSAYIVTMLALLIFVLACGPGEEPTAIPTAIPTATPTAKPLVVATSTPTPTGPVATPTPTSAPISTPKPTPKKGGVLQVGQYQEMQHYDPQSIAGLTPSEYNAPIYNQLFYNSEGQSVICEICVNEQYQLENAGKTMVINVKPGIKFHNGKEMTAADVKYSLEKMMGEIDGVVSPRCGGIKEYTDNIQAPSTYVLRINLMRPSAFIPKVLSLPHCVLLPAGTTRAQLLDAPFGSGPFILKERVTGSHVRYERNPNYFKPGLPYLDALVARRVANADAELVAFIAGRLDITARTTGTRPIDYVTPVQRLVDRGAAINVTGEAVGMSGVGMMVAKPPFDNVKMRQAVNLAVDRAEYGKVFMDNRYTAALSFISASGFGRPESEIWDVVPGWGRGAKKQQEIAQAKQLVTEVGYSSNVELGLMTTTQSATGATVAIDELIQAQLAAIGIRTKINIVTNAERDILQAEGRWDVARVVAVMLTGDPDEFFGSYFITGGSRNVSFYSNAGFDKLFVAMSSELDPVKRRQLVRQMEDSLVIQEAVYGPAPKALQDYTWYAYVKGYDPMGLSPGNNNRAFRKESVWLDK